MVFIKDKTRFPGHELSQRMLIAVVQLAGDQVFVSDEHLMADGTRIQACASQKSIVQKDDLDMPPQTGAQFFR